MKRNKTFAAASCDYFGYVSPNNMMREANEVAALANYEDGVGYSNIFYTLGVTWMLGQCVLEYKSFVPCAEEVEIEAGGHEHFGPTVVRRTIMRHNGQEAMRYSAKSLPVDFEARRVVESAVLAPFWKTEPIPAGEPIPFIVPPKDMVTEEVFKVHYRDCDVNQHMTAFKYMDLAMETIGYWRGEPRLPKRIQIDFLKEARMHEVLELRYAQENGVHYCSGVKEDGSVSFNASVILSEETYPYATIKHV